MSGYYSIIISSFHACNIILFLLIITLSLYENCPLKLFKIVLNLILWISDTFTWLIIQKYVGVKSLSLVLILHLLFLPPFLSSETLCLVSYISFQCFFMKIQANKYGFLSLSFYTECSLLLLQHFFLASYWHTLEIFLY